MNTSTTGRPASDAGTFAACDWHRPLAPIRSRVAYAAVHVVPDPWGDNSTDAPHASIDWDSTLAFRHQMWSWGLGVAEAMDTAQRGMGLDWAVTRELITRSGAEARAVGGSLACGAGTDQLDMAELAAGRAGLDAVIAAYREQIEVIEAAGGTVILMASRALARIATKPEDFRRVYDTLLSEIDEPVILHWLGPAFDPALRGYWGSDDIDLATATVVDLIRAHPAKIDGIKVSLLDADHEIRLRSALPPGVRMYTGDDYHYPELIVGDGRGHSDAMLGVFAAIYPAASAALQALDRGDTAQARDLLDSTQALGRHLFAPPTRFYKTGIAFLNWLNGLQPGFAMVAGAHSGRSLPHLLRVYELAGQAGLLRRPDLAAGRFESLLALHGADPRTAPAWGP